MNKMKQKTIMDMTPQELIKSLTASIAETTKAQINTALIPVHAEIRELKQGQEKIERRLDGVEQRLERVEQKLDKVAKDHEDRIEIIEEHLELPHKN